MALKLLVGLGNPGREHARNRHSIGFQCLDEFAHRHGLTFRRRQAKALTAEGQVHGVPVLLAKPQTFMNRSGESVGQLVRYYRLSPADLIVIHDELDLPTGKVRIRPAGSAAGNHGMESIIKHLGRQDFARIRIGIGRPAWAPTDPEAVARWVLSDFGREEEVLMQRVRQWVAEALDAILTQGLERGMNKYNLDPPADP